MSGGNSPGDLGTCTGLGELADRQAICDRSRCGRARCDAHENSHALSDCLSHRISVSRTVSGRDSPGDLGTCTGLGELADREDGRQGRPQPVVVGADAIQHAG